MMRNSRMTTTKWRFRHTLWPCPLSWHTWRKCNMRCLRKYDAPMCPLTPRPLVPWSSWKEKWTWLARCGWKKTIVLVNVTCHVARTRSSTYLLKNNNLDRTWYFRITLFDKTIDRGHPTCDGERLEVNRVPNETDLIRELVRPSRPLSKTSKECNRKNWHWLYIHIC